MNNKNTIVPTAACRLARASRCITVLFFSCVMLALVGCRGGGAGNQRDDFFTSGSREADQRAAQRMAKEQQTAGPGEQQKGATNAAKVTLYDRLGGEQGLAAIVDDFTARAMEDPRVNWSRGGSERGGVLRRNNDGWKATPENVVNLKKHLVQFLSLATGGPTQYDGKEMKSAHAGMRISNPEFDATIGDLKASLDKLQVSDKEQKELLAIIESTRPQIVTER